MDRITSGPQKDCSWLFEFTIVTTERQYELHAPTRDDRDHWIKIFKIIVKMNKKGLNTRDTNPLKFDKQKEESPKT